MSIGMNVGRPRQHNAMQRPKEPNFIREAVALVDAADQPIAAEDVVIDIVLIGAGAEGPSGEALRGITVTPPSV